MGTDLYLYAERRVAQEWHSVAAVDLELDESQVDVECAGEPYEFDLGRSRLLFGVLTGRDDNVYEEIPPITSVRGLPVDISSGVLGEAEELGECGFTHSWVTLHEIDEYVAQGLMVMTSKSYPPEVAAVYRRTGEEPAGYSPEDYGIPNGSWEFFDDRPAPVEQVSGLDRVMTLLRPLGKPQDVRIVFWLDG